ncbi:MAG TPA: hypothetical protein PL165_07625 [Methanofastidiosum sp.]|nr:hypothetical protein [Methanofastidiosum sp.]
MNGIKAICVATPDAFENKDFIVAMEDSGVLISIVSKEMFSAQFGIDTKEITIDISEEAFEILVKESIKNNISISQQVTKILKETLSTFKKGTPPYNNTESEETT